MFVAGTRGEFPALEDAEGLALVERPWPEPGRSTSARRTRGTPAAWPAAGARRLAAILPVTAPAGSLRGALAGITSCYRPAEPAEVMAYYREIGTAADAAELNAHIFSERSGSHPAPAHLVSSPIRERTG